MSEYIAMVNNGWMKRKRERDRARMRRLDKIERERQYRVVNDDDPMDYAFPVKVTLHDLRENGDMQTYRAVRHLRIGKSATVGGGAGTQFTLTRLF